MRVKILALLAWLNVIAHALGLAFAAVAMSPGSPIVPLESRVQYLASKPLGWTLGWSTWMACAVLLILFLVVVYRRLGVTSTLAQIGLSIAIVGAAFDLLCDAVYIYVLPMVAASKPFPEQLFLAVERSTGIGSLLIANGAYSVALALYSAALHERGLNRLAVWLGYAVAGAGLTLAGAAFTNSMVHAQWATVLTMGLFAAWVLVVARAFETGNTP